jgi:hypothetical protein
VLEGWVTRLKTFFVIIVVALQYLTLNLGLTG